jgi:hypothetical protein
MNIDVISMQAPNYLDLGEVVVNDKCVYGHLSSSIRALYRSNLTGTLAKYML